MQLDLVEAIAMATARNLLGEQPEERLRVWYHNGEDPFDRDHAPRRRYLSALLDPHDGVARPFVHHIRERIPAAGRQRLQQPGNRRRLLGQISTCIADNEIDLAIFDPLVTLHSVSELDTGKMDTVVRLFASIADDNDAAIELAHHVRKPGAGINADYDVNDIRGVTAITDAVRAARLLNRMSEKDAEARGCDERAPFPLPGRPRQRQLQPGPGRHLAAVHQYRIAQQRRGRRSG